MSTWVRMVELLTRVETCLTAAGRPVGTSTVSWCPVPVFATDTGCCDHLIVHPASTLSTGSTVSCSSAPVRFEILVARCVPSDTGPVTVGATPGAPAGMTAGTQQHAAMLLAFDLDTVLTCLSGGCDTNVWCPGPDILGVTRECGTNCQGFRVLVESGQ